MELTCREFTCPRKRFRIGFFLDDTDFTSLNPNGLALFDAAVGYGMAAVPEPSTFVLAALGILALAGRRFARRK